MMEAIKTVGLTKRYKDTVAVNKLDLEINDGELFALLGVNGAGKSTTVNMLSCLTKVSEGDAFIKGHSILREEKAIKQIIGVAPQETAVAPNLSVKENLEMGAYTRKDKAGIKADMEMVYGLFPRLKERVKQLSGTLSGGEQQMLAMGRALMSKPKLLLLDEPSMGLAPILVDEIFSIIQEINKTGTTILLVEQNAFKALSIADRAYILETGTVIKSGKASDLINDEAVKSAYLGG